MKKTAVVAVFALLLSVSGGAQMGRSSKQYSFGNLVGAWRTPKGAGIDVVDSATIYLVAGEKRRPAVITKADFSRNPVWFDVTVKDSANVTALKSLLLFVNDNTLQWQVFDSETQPVSFRYTRGDMIYLKRVQTVSN